MPAPKKAPVQTKTRAKSPRISYERFYAIRFCIELEVAKAKDITAFFKISYSTYARVALCKDYASYKRLIGNNRINGADKKIPTDAPATKRGVKAVDTTGIPAADATLDKAKQVLSLAQGVLEQANKLPKQAVYTAAKQPAKRGWFGRTK